MKTLKKVAAVLAASMALNAVAFTGAFSASAEEDVTVIGYCIPEGPDGNIWLLGRRQYWKFGRSYK